MNWIDFSKERPKADPHRAILICVKTKTKSDPDWMEGYKVTVSQDIELAHRITHWAEIEPPPKPDPFEEAWKKHPTIHPTSGVEFVAFKAGWDAAIKWKEGKWTGPS